MWNPVSNLVVVALLVVVVRSDAIDGNSTAPLERSEQEALYNVIQGFVGKGWDGKQLYPDPCGWTPIQGVGCDLIEGQWHITSLSFGPVFDNSLKCSNSPQFKEDLFLLTHLTSLSFFLCFTSTTTPLPTNWSSLSSSLTSLHLRSNPSLSGPLPPSFSLLTSLHSLILTSSSVSGPILPNMFQHMNNLLILDLSRNSLVGQLPPSLASLSSLLKLDLSFNMLEGKLPEDVGTLNMLTLLDLRGNRVVGGVPTSLEDVGSLQALLLSENPLGGSISGFNWGKLKNLTILDLSRTWIEGSIPESIAEMDELRFLALDNNRLVGGVPAKIATLRSIGSLYLNGNNLSGVLAFDDGFVGRLGRRLAVWGNPHLCYSVGVEGRSFVPHGVSQCSGDASSSSSSSSYASNNVGGSDKSSSDLHTCGDKMLMLVLWVVVVVVLDLGFGR